MTAERLKEIVQRHKESAPLDPRWGPISECDYATVDRGELLELLGRIARGPNNLDGLRRFIEDLGGVCLMCFEEPHAPDCPAPALESLRAKEEG